MRRAARASRFVGSATLARGHTQSGQQLKVRLEGSTGLAVAIGISVFAVLDCASQRLFRRTGTGVNPSFLRRDFETEFSRMEENKEYEITDGTIIKVHVPPASVFSLSLCLSLSRDQTDRHCFLVGCGFPWSQICCPLLNFISKIDFEHED